METQWFVNQQCRMRSFPPRRLCRHGLEVRGDRFSLISAIGTQRPEGGEASPEEGRGILFDKVLALL